MLRQFLFFSAIGTAGFAVDAGVLLLMLKVAGCGLYLSRAVSYLCAATFTWAANRQLTFAGAYHGAKWRQWGKFLAANAVGGAVNLAIYALLVWQFKWMAQFPAIAVGAGSLAGLAINFTLSRTLVFRAHGLPTRTT